METTKQTQGVHDNSPNVTPDTDEHVSDTYKSLVVGCKKARISIAKLCRTADVSQSVIQRWKKEEPLSIKIYSKLLKALEEINSNQ